MIGPLSYIGGKNRLANLIISQIPPHKTYVEPFAGGAQVFFHKPPSKVEILNDLSDDIVNFFRICQSHAPELIRYVQHMVAARSWFALLQKMDPEVLTDIQRAARLLLQLSFAKTPSIFKMNDLARLLGHRSWPGLRRLPLS